MMATNNYKPHLHVLPEDDANRQMANGFILNPNLNERVIQILPIVGGWAKVLQEFKDNHVRAMERYSERRMVLIIDFDNDRGRIDNVKKIIPENLTDRVFVLGVLSNPGKLNSQFNNKGLENIGTSLSRECSDNTWEVWEHDLLKHNQAELARMVESVKPFLFKSV